MGLSSIFLSKPLSHGDADNTHTQGSDHQGNPKIPVSSIKYQATTAPNI